MLRRASVIAASLVLALVTAGAGPVTAQQEAPGIGTPFQFVDSDGAARGSVTATEVADPFEGFEPTRPPEPGTRFVTVTITFEAAADQTFDAQPSHFLLQATDGTIWSRQFVSRPAESLIPDLEGQTMAPGNRISGIVAFILPEGAELARVLYQPASDRLVSLVELLPRSGPAAGEPVTFVTEQGGSIRITTEVADPFEGFDPSYPPEAGMRYVMLTLVVENDGELPVEVDPYDVQLRDIDGYLTRSATIFRPPEVRLPVLESQTTAPGDRISGVIGFIVPADAQLSGVDYQPDLTRLLTIVDLTGGVAPAGSPVPTVTPEPAASAVPVGTTAPVATEAPIATPAATALPSAGTAR